MKKFSLSFRQIFIIILFSSLLLYCHKSSNEPEGENIVRGSHILTDTLKSNYGLWETVQLPPTNNYFEFDITWGYIYENLKEKNWRLTFKPVSRKIQIIPEEGNKLLAPVEGYSGEEHAFIYWAPSIPNNSEDKATFFYLSSDKTLYGRLDCKTYYYMNTLSEREKTIYVKLEYSWMVRTDGGRNFPE